jgi:pimeloyl-ACP methyl ester carboxylesterase
MEDPMSSGRRRNLISATVLLAFAPVLAGGPASAGSSSPAPGAVLIAESRSKAKCESVDNRIFVTTKLGTECIAYFVSRGFESRRQAVLFFGGDASKLQKSDPAKLEVDLRLQKRAMQQWADRLRVRYIYVSRVGLQGSSGNHAERRLPKETFVMNAVVDALKAKLGFDDIALVGQSGGGTIAAALLTLGRQDVRCEVLGSSATRLVDLEYDFLIQHGGHPIKTAMHRKIYDPSDHIDTIARRADRRIFALADPSDKVVAFKYQAQFIDQVKTAGHSARLIEVDGTGEHHHDAEKYALPVAGACLNEVADEPIIAAVARGRSWAERTNALSQLPWQFKRWKPPVGPLAGLKTAAKLAN